MPPEEWIKKLRISDKTGGWLLLEAGEKLRLDTRRGFDAYLTKDHIETLQHALKDYLKLGKFQNPKHRGPKKVMQEFITQGERNERA